MTDARWRGWAELTLGAGSALLLALGAAWGVGFARFDNAAHLLREPPMVADGIVVLTGGADRIDTALHLLADGRAPFLLVSGVSGGAELADLTRRVPLDPGQAVRVTLGRTAQSTLGNAAETTLWVQALGIKRLIVVTAGYHMPRALLELRHALPEVELHPVPVQSPALRGASPAATVRLLSNEYTKLLAVRFGLARLLRSGEPS